MDLPVRLIAANQLYEEVLGHVPVGMIDAAWYRYIMHPRFRASGRISKRAFDLIFGSVMAFFFLPVVALAALAIKLDDRGPVFYRQRRLGELGDSFDILKLRTMRIDAEADGPQWSTEGDSRVTRVGRLLRRSHIDEVPQLWNVLRGDMTLVGPRPERPEMVAELERRFPHYTRRQLVKPGIAGWAALRCGYARLRHRHRLEALPRPLLHQAPLDARGHADPRRDRRRGLPRRPPGPAGPPANASSSASRASA